MLNLIKARDYLTCSDKGYTKRVIGQCLAVELFDVMKF
jgi:hypothetical protein